ncbi:MAG: UbiD family decarboxylase [Rhodospirillaceae bacterium]|nr:UbiD family decarboxylase [Rhodospirillaceae bacterium]
MNKLVDPDSTMQGSSPQRQNTPSMRNWLATLDSNNQLRQIDTLVDWNEEIGAIARINIAQQGPGLYFSNIRDYQDTISTKFVTCGISNKAQIRLMLDLDDGVTDKMIVRHLKETYCNPIRPVTVDYGPVKENILTGEVIDLNQFPAPRWHACDGGKFIDTFCGVITHDPKTDRPNVGLYRGQVLSANKIGKLLIPTQGWGAHFLNYRDSKGRMPVAIAYGWHDVMPFCAGSPFPKHVCEWDMMGAILGKPVELIDCETIPLQVPATAEIAVEGWIDPDPATWEMEGPFADYPGYLGGKPSRKPVVDVSCITHRHDPIMRGALEGARPGFPSEDSLLCAYSWSAIAWNLLEAAGVSGITDVWMPPVVTGTNIVVQVRKQYRGHAQQIGMALWGTNVGQWFFKNVMVVEEDIDIRNPEALEWAYGFRVNAGRGDVWLVGPTFGSVLDPSTLREDRDAQTHGTGKWTRTLIDATRSWEHQPNPDWDGNRWPAVNTIDPDLEHKIAARWSAYGIGVPYLDDGQREQLTLEETRKILNDL